MINVTCAVIRNEENEILIVQRGENTDHPFKWEFPGGKVDPGETEEECIIREIREELSIDIVIFGRLPVIEHNYGHKQIRLIPFICDTLNELPFLTEHIAFKWVDTAVLGKTDFSEADVFVANDYIRLSGNCINSEEPETERRLLEKVDEAGIQEMVNKIMGTKQAEWLAVSAIENPAVFKKLLEYSYSADKKLAFHASWTLTKVCDRYPEIIYPFLAQIVSSLEKIDNESTIRSFLRILSLTDIDKISARQHGPLADYCFKALNSGLTAIGIKAYSMEILFQLTVRYPELANELSASIKSNMEEGSAGITSRGRMILKKIADLPGKPA
jgi:8-oxo-dGTP diphosphatase